MREDLAEVSAQVKELQVALDTEGARVRSLEKDLQASRAREVPSAVSDVPAVGGAHSRLSAPEEVVSSKIHSCSQEVRSVLLSLKAKGVSSPPPRDGTADEACECLSRDVKLLGGAARAYGRTMATHTLAMGVSAVLASDGGWEVLRDKLTAPVRAFYEKNKTELTKASLKFVIARDPGKRAEGEGSSTAE